MNLVSLVEMTVPWVVSLLAPATFALILCAINVHLSKKTLLVQAVSTMLSSTKLGYAHAQTDFPFGNRTRHAKNCAPQNANGVKARKIASIVKMVTSSYTTQGSALILAQLGLRRTWKTESVKEF